MYTMSINNVEIKALLAELCSGLPLNPLPENNKRNPSIAHAAKRSILLNKAERQVTSDNPSNTP